MQSKYLDSICCETNYRLIKRTREKNLADFFLVFDFQGVNRWSNNFGPNVTKVDLGKANNFYDIIVHKKFTLFELL